MISLLVVTGAGSEGMPRAHMREEGASPTLNRRRRTDTDAGSR